MSNLSFSAAFIAGVLSFLSPCVLPLAPGYLSLLSGVSMEALKDAEQAKRVWRRVMLCSLCFVLGFSVVFISLGAAATSLGRLMNQHRDLFSTVAGVVVIVLGLHMTGLLRINALYSDKRLHGVKASGYLGSFLVGFAFAFGWTPCIGPILAGILALASGQDSVARGVELLAVYSLGLAIPFLLTALGLNAFMRFYARFRRHLHKVEVVSGALLILFGLLIAFGRLDVLSRHLGFLNGFAQ